jgi:hypothetical protein
VIPILVTVVTCVALVCDLVADVSGYPKRSKDHGWGIVSLAMLIGWAITIAVYA